MRTFFLAATLATLATQLIGQDRTELARQYVNMPAIQDMMTQMFSPEAMSSQMLANLPPDVQLTEDQKNRIGEVLSSGLLDLRPRLDAVMVESSAETFTADELQAMIDFYGSPQGAAVMAKMQPFMVDFTRRIAPDMQAMYTQVSPELIEIVQEEE